MLEPNSLVRRLAASEPRDLRMTLDEESVLEVFPDKSAARREQWRFIGGLGGHLVVGGDGLEYLP
jgi:hypothetical protein